jgi:hypothetical protein
MSRIIGEAKFDSEKNKWYFVIYHENGDVIFESGAIFDSQEAAEQLLVEALRGLAKEFPPRPDNESQPSSPPSHKPSGMG